jgi:hypothetical protein
MHAARLTECAETGKAKHFNTIRVTSSCEINHYQLTTNFKERFSITEQANQMFKEKFNQYGD